MPDASTGQLRIVSLLPAATEIVAALGLADRLVGRSHECDEPAAVATLPALTAPRIDPAASSREIHEQVGRALEGTPAAEQAAGVGAALVPVAPNSALASQADREIQTHISHLSHSVLRSRFEGPAAT